MINPIKNQFFCNRCGASYPLNESRWRCNCGSFLDIEFNARFDLKKIKTRKPSLWRYREAIPLDLDKNIVSFQEGFSPLIEIPILNRPVLFKLDYLFQTGSFKDRGATVLVSKIKELGIKSVVEDSSGNAGTAIAAYCAKSGIECHIFTPASTSPEKLRQIIAYGAHLKKIAGIRENAAKAAFKQALTQYYASHSWNPYFLQGTKTFSYEICEQLGWKAPEILVLPVGNGTLLLGAYVGFLDLLRNGIIKKIPRLIAVQAANCAPLFRIFKNLPGQNPANKTMAEGIAVNHPIRGLQIIDAVKKTGGDFILVGEKDIFHSQIDISRKGYFIEPTSAVVIAGIQKYIEKTKSTDIIVSALTGHGLKTGNRKKT
jgi:threonine synthase